MVNDRSDIKSQPMTEYASIAKMMVRLRLKPPTDTFWNAPAKGAASRSVTAYSQATNSDEVPAPKNSNNSRRKNPVSIMPMIVLTSDVMRVSA